MSLIWWLLIGLVAGGIARLLVPGRDPIGWLGTLILGLVGSVVGGFLGQLVGGEGLHLEEFTPAGLLGSVIGAVIALLAYRWWVARSGGTSG